MEQLTLFPNSIKSCALTGHRVLQADFDETAFQNTLVKLVEEGVEVFYNGLAVGFDLLAAKLIIELKKNYPSVKLVGCVPFYGQEKNFSAEDKKLYAEVLKHCDVVYVLSDYYYAGCFFKRNDYMCEHADLLVAYQRSNKGGTAYTVKKFRKKGGKIIFL